MKSDGKKQETERENEDHRRREIQECGREIWETKFN